MRRTAAWRLAVASILAFLVLGASERAWSQIVTPGNVFPLGCAPGGNPAPRLSGVAPGTVAAGARQQRLTIVGTNFRAGAKVIITVPNTDPPQFAPDVTVSATVVNGGLMFAYIDVNRLSSGTRIVDVANADCSNTDPALSGFNFFPFTLSSQQIFITGGAGNSLAGPVQVDNLIVTYPRDGTVVNQGDDLYGEAVLAGAGTGLVTGTWLWDGNVNEQFTAHLSGGERTVLRTSIPLPTFYLGRHTLELQITSPQSMVSRLVRVIVDSGDFKLLRLLLPRSGEGFGDVTPPTLHWTAVPGVSRYEVGFSTQPHFDSIGDWYEASDNRWQVPAKIWSRLPEGELYWTVRPVEISGQIRRPAPMRSIWHMSPGVLEAASAQPGISPGGSVLLQWHGLRAHVFYRVTITRDAEGADVVRRYLTASAQADLYALRNLLQPNQTFYWQVQALSPAGQLIRSGPRQSFVVPAGAHARLNRPTLREASLRAPAISADLAASIARHSPASGESVASDQPPIDVVFSQAVDASKLALSVDSTDVTAVAEVGATTLKYAPVFPLDNGAHTVELDVSPDSASWKFTVAHKEPPPPLTVLPTAKNDAEVVPRKEAATAGVPGQIGPEFKTHFGFNPQAGSSPTPNQVTLTGGQQTTFQNGPWRAEINGTAALDALLSPGADRLFGHVQDYNALVSYKRQGWGINARFGLIAPDLYRDAQFVTTATARQSVEPQVFTPAGTASYYANTNDRNLGAGDASSFDQLIRGAGYQAPLPAKWGAFRLMWMDAKEVGTPTTVLTTNNGPIPNSNLYPPPAIDQQASPGAADAYGGLLKLQLPSSFALVSEYAVSYNNASIFPPVPAPGAGSNPPAIPNPIPQSGAVACTFSPDLQHLFVVPPEVCGVGSGGKRLYGRAWRSGLAGKWRKTTITVAYRDVSTNFSTPVNPGITPYSNPGRKGFDSSVSEGTPIGDFNVGFQYLKSLATPESPIPVTFRNVTWGWKKGLKSKTQFSLRGHDVTTTSGSLPPALQGIDLATLNSEATLVDQHDIGFQGSIVQQMRSLTLTATASRDWFRNDLNTAQDSIVTGTQFGAVWRRQSLFQLQSNVSANWTVGDKTTIGSSRVLSLYLMPMFMWQHTGLSLTPLASITQTRGSLGSATVTADMLTSQFGGRLSWRLSSKFRRPTLSVEGARVQMQNNLATAATPSFNMVDKRLAILLSFAHDQTQGRL